LLNSRTDYTHPIYDYDTKRWRCPNVKSTINIFLNSLPVNYQQADILSYRRPSNSMTFPLRQMMVSVLSVSARPPRQSVTGHKTEAKCWPRKILRAGIATATTTTTTRVVVWIFVFTCNSSYCCSMS